MVRDQLLRAWLSCSEVGPAERSLPSLSLSPHKSAGESVLFLFICSTNPTPMGRNGIVQDFFTPKAEHRSARM